MTRRGNPHRFKGRTLARKRPRVSGAKKRNKEKARARRLTRRGHVAA